MRSVDLLNQGSLDSSRNICLEYIAFGFAGLEVLNCQWARLTVALSNLVNYSDGLFI